MTTKIRKWGNSYAVRISKAKVHELGMREGSAVDIKLKPLHRKPTLDELIAQIDPNNLPELVDWGPDVGTEIVEWKE